MTWKVVAGSATGPTHLARGEVCQDAYDWRCDEHWLVAIVCDGAGSARFGDTGAQHAARSLCRDLFASIPRNGSDLTDTAQYWHSRVVCAIDRARNSLVMTHVRNGDSLNDFHSTLVGAIAGPDTGWFFQIGDGGGAAVIEKQWSSAVLTLPENGQYADETFFYTEDHWRQHLRFTPFPSESDLLTLMTDGAMTFVMARGRAGLDAKFIEPVTRFLDNVDVETGKEALVTTLDDPRTFTITSDDKTFLWARRGG